MAEKQKKSVLFVCLGNICRSPMAELVMKATVAKMGVVDQWHIDSAGTSSYHIGDSPDDRSVSTCKKFLGDAMPPNTHRARQVTKSDFTTFDYVLCMDESNLSDLKRIAPKNTTAVVDLLGSFDPKGDTIIEDPYYGGINGFEHNFYQCQRCCEALVTKAGSAL